MHGAVGNASAARGIMMQRLEKENVCIVAPQLYTKPDTPSHRMVLCGVKESNEANELLPKDIWTTTMLQEIFEGFQQIIPGLEKYIIYGHSAGGQFAFRAGSLFAEPNLDYTIAANAGTYTFLDPNKAFRHGIKDLTDDYPSFIRDSLARKVIILAGNADTKKDSWVADDLLSMEQGVNRYERAHNCFDHASQIAQSTKSPFNWELTDMDGVGHSSETAANWAKQIILSAK
jgi:hypothetical protein